MLAGITILYKLNYTLIAEEMEILRGLVVKIRSNDNFNETLGEVFKEFSLTPSNLTSHSLI